MNQAKPAWQKKRKNHSEGYLGGAAMKQWRPKLQAQSLPGAGNNQVAEHLSKEIPPENTVSVTVNEAVVQLLRCRRSKMKHKIEADTKTSLFITKAKGGCSVAIQGSSKESVESAAAKIKALLEKTDTDINDDTRESGSNAASKQSLKGMELLQWKAKAAIHTVSTDISEVGACGEERVTGCIQIDNLLLRLVKGKKNEVKERIEKETNTTIVIGSPVVVTGASEESVQSALQKIQKVIEEAVNDRKFQYTHFISLPLIGHPALVKQLEDFRDSVLTSLGIPLEDEAVAAKTGKDGEESSEKQIDETKLTATSGAETTSVLVGTSWKVKNQGTSISAIDSEAQTTKREQIILEEVFRESVMCSLGLERDKEAAADGEAIENADAPIPQGAAMAEEDNGQVHAPVAQGAVMAEDDIGQVDAPVAEAVTAQEDADQVVMSSEPETKASDHHHQLEEDTKEEGAQGDLVLNGKPAEELKYEPLEEVPMIAKKKGEVVSEPKSGIEKSIFIKPTKFHLTILMLKLWNEERVQKASEVLQKCLPNVAAALEGRPLSVSLQGLEIMRGSPKNTRVLFAKVSEVGEGNRLLQACQVLIDAFVESGLVLGKDREQALKLHATVMNTSHRGSKSKFKNRGFDATEIMEKYGKTNWGEYQILEAHLSQRFKYDENDYYHCCSSIPFTGEPTKNQEDEKAAET